MIDSPQPAPADPSVPPTSAWRSPAAVAVFVLIVLAVVAGDLALKVWSFDHVAGRPVVIDPADPRQSVPMHPPIDLIPHVLALQLTANTGAVFGLGQGGKWFFVLISLAAVVVIATLFARSLRTARGYHAAPALVLGGAIGNLHDRVRFNAVRDMLKLFPGVRLPWGLSWPGGPTEVYPWIFNVADSALVVGVLMLVVILSRADGKRRQNVSSTRG